MSQEKYQFPWEIQKEDHKSFPKEGGIEETGFEQVDLVWELHPPPHRR